MKSVLLLFTILTAFFLTQSTYAQVPAAPSDLDAVTISSTKILLTWTDNSTNEAGFKIERKSSWNNDTAFRTVGLAHANDTAFMNNHLRPDTWYYFRVRAVNNAGASHYSNVDSAMTNTDTNFVVPNAPSDLTGTANSPRSVDLEWNDNSANEMKFVIEKRSTLGPDSVFRPVGHTHRNDTTFRVMGLRPDTEYNFRVAAVNQAGMSDYSNIATVRTLPDSNFHIIPNAPTNLDAVLLEHNRVRLTWHDNSNNEKGFGIEAMKSTDTAFRRVAVTGRNHTSIILRRLQPNTVYYFRVFAFNMAGRSDYSNIDTVSTQNGNAIADGSELETEIELAGEFKLHSNFPNPFNPSTIIAFELPEAGVVSLKIFDMVGREVSTIINNYMNAGYHETKFNASSLASGMYFYRLTTSGHSDIKKMLLVK